MGSSRYPEFTVAQGVKGGVAMAAHAGVVGGGVIGGLGGRIAGSADPGGGYDGFHRDAPGVEEGLRVD